MVYLVADGNGFKTSTMRLGADVIVFSRASQSGYDLLSYLASLVFLVGLEKSEFKAF